MTEEEVFARPDFAKNMFREYPGVIVDYNMEGEPYSWHSYVVYLKRLWLILNPVEVTG